MENKFPILGSEPKEYIPLDIIKPHEKQALRNHGQTLKRLAERGGLGWIETLCVLEDREYDFHTKLTEMSARIKVLEIIKRLGRVISKEEWIVELTESNSEIWGSDIDCGSREEAIEKGMKAAKKEGLKSFRIGRQEYCGMAHIDVDAIIEDAQAQLYNEVGEASETYLEDVTKEFYSDYYHIDLNDQQVTDLLKSSGLNESQIA